nr:MAG TPA: Kelch-like ECH-associated protein 1, Peptide-propeller, Kelch motif,Degron, TRANSCRIPTION.57A [Caudoviricetes sp.]
MFKLQGKITLVKSVFSLYSCVLCDLIEIVWQQ